MSTKTIENIAISQSIVSGRGK